MRKKTVLLLSVLALAFGVSMTPKAANGTVLIQKDLRDLVVESTDIVLGKVVDMSVGWNKEETRIYTNVVLTVEKGIKGDFVSGEKVHFQTIGGKVGEVSLSVPSSPQFKVGEKVVVFFGGEPNVNTPVTGWEQGKFTVENDIVLENGMYLDDFIGDIEGMMNRVSR